MLAEQSPQPSVPMREEKAGVFVELPEVALCRPVATDPKLPSASGRSPVEQRLHGGCDSGQKVRGLDRTPVDEAVPGRLELLVFLELVAVRFVEGGVLFAKFG